MKFLRLPYYNLSTEWPSISKDMMNLHAIWHKKVISWWEMIISDTGKVQKNMVITAIFVKKMRLLFWFRMSTG